MTPIILRNYLRVRGEYQYRSSNICLIMELPPRARRIRYDRNVKTIPIGTTSACAENTPYTPVPFAPTRNYLRVRGEYQWGKHPHRGGEELPPRARRIPRRGLVLADEIGTTSACAENTAACTCNFCVERNYLRVRGEYCAAVIAAPQLMELPPRARRILDAHPPGHSIRGTTSACAENTGFCRI